LTEPQPRGDLRLAPELVDSAYWFETNDAPLLHHDLTLSDLAHILHLAELGLLPRQVAQVLVRSLLELDRDPEFRYDPQYGDAFTNRARWLQAHAPEAVGYLSVGRSRREATTVAFRMLVRRHILRLARAVLGAQTALLDLAALHGETLMPDYTYLQAAHPTSFAHYLLSFVYPLLRDSFRLHEAFELLNQSPAGIGSTNGSPLPIRRERLAETLGFDGVIVNARDAMWQVDAPLAAMNAAATLLLHLDRLAEDLQIFNSAEFGFIQLGAEFTRPSVIMPQKKNPYPLAFIRGAAGLAIGRVTELYAIARTPSAQADNRLAAHGELPRALDLTERCVKLMAGVCASLRVCAEPMARRVQEGFTQATDLAEMLMLEHGVDYRSAHEIVGRVVNQLQARNGTARDITAALLSESARVLGHALNVSETQLAAALDPARLVEARLGTGGAAPVRVKEMIADCRTHMQAQQEWIQATSQRIEGAESKLVQNAEEF
jgi:argininosuccinate lyase